MHRACFERANLQGCPGRGGSMETACLPWLSDGQSILAAPMSRRAKRLDLSTQFQQAIFAGLSRASVRLTVDREDYLDRIRRAHGLSIGSFRDMFFVPQETVDHLADQTISAAIKLATIEGTGLG